MANKLAIFDIDGTLIRHHPDGNDVCFVRVVEEEFGIGGINIDWSVYRNPTDTGIFTELFLRKHGRFPGPDDIALAKKCLLAGMKAWAAGGRSFTEVPGGKTILRGLQDSGWVVAIATGNWGETGRFKLGSAGIWHSGVPYASSDDSESKEGIVACAIERARSSSGECRVVYVGDRPWDLKAARELKTGFLGVSEGRMADELKAAGAVAVIAGLDDVHAVEKMLGEMAR
jgi:phosphoglycolate phosphatase-like HAD superfamily hydrolase